MSKPVIVRVLTEDNNAVAIFEYVNHPLHGKRFVSRAAALRALDMAGLRLKPSGELRSNYAEVHNA